MVNLTPTEMLSRLSLVFLGALSCKACNLHLLVQGISVDALSMLREAVNLTPDAKPSPSAHSQAAASPPADGFDSDSEEQAPQPSARARQSSSQQCVAGLGNCRATQQGQEGDRGAVVLREAYRGMLLQQQAKHRAELDKRQAKYQSQLDAQVWLCWHALHVMVTAKTSPQCRNVFLLSPDVSELKGQQDGCA